MLSEKLVFEISDYVLWHEDYDDGISGRDWGTGIVIEKRDHDAYGHGKYIMYRVYRNKHKDLYWFENRQLKLKEIK